MNVCLFRRSILLALAGGMAMVAKGYAQHAPSPAVALLINNVRIFNGIDDQLRPGNLLIVDSKIRQMSPDPIAAPPDSQVIDGGGRADTRA